MRKTQFVVITMLLAFLVSFQNAHAVVKNRTALSPYIQADANSTYTFVGISHPSLATAVTQIGLTVATVGLDTTNPTETFTIAAGETYRIFVVATNHSSINSSTVTDAGVLFLGVSSGSSQKGSLLVTSSFSNPAVQAPISAPFAVARSKFGDLGQLSMWGAIVIPSTSSGFAMEFIGDAHDSQSISYSATRNHLGADTGIAPGNQPHGRGLN